MGKIDTSQWREFIIGDYFRKCDLKCKKADLNKAFDLSLERTEEFNLPLVNAKHSNNGIMYYGREADWESEEMTIDIVSNGAISTGDVYAQPGRTGVMWDAYLVKPLWDCKSENVLKFVACVIERCVKQHFGYDNKCTWDKVKQHAIYLPADDMGNPDSDYMESYMRSLEPKANDSLNKFLKVNNMSKKRIDVSEWREFRLTGESGLFTIERPNARKQHDYEEGGVPFVASGNFNNGVQAYLTPHDGERLDRGNCITVSPVDGFAFYQKEDFLGRGGAGSSILILRSDKLTLWSGLFLASLITHLCSNWGYSNMGTPEKLNALNIPLPVDTNGAPDWQYMEQYMQRIRQRASRTIDILTGLMGRG